MKNRRLLKFGIVVFFAVFCFSFFNKTIAGSIVGTLPEQSGNPSDCELIEGSGERKIVAIFDGNPAPSDMTINLAKEAMLRVFQKLEPYKSYNNFSFYIDKQTRDYLYDSEFKSKAALNNIILRPSVLDYACGKAFLYVYFVKNIPKIGSYTYVDFPVIYIDLDQALSGTTKLESQEPYIEQTLSGLIAHESGHAIGGINDEYPLPAEKQGSYWDLLFSNTVQTSEQRTCVHEPNSLYRSSIDKKLYGLTTVSGCYDPILNTFKTFYRPSQNSIMNSAFATNRRFNVISCGYILAGLHGETLEKNNAEKYWPQCCSTSGVDRQGITGCLPTVSTTTVTVNFPANYSCPVVKTGRLSFPPISSGSILSSREEKFLFSFHYLATNYLANFFNINTKDVSTTTSGGIKAIPVGDLAYIPAGSSTVFEMDIAYCRSARVDLQKSITSTSSPITSIGGIPTGSGYIVSSSTLQLEFPADNNCPVGFINRTTLPASATSTVISALGDIALPSIPNGETNVFKINGKDVSTTTTDGVGGRKIPAGDLASIPANTAVEFETYSRYCDDGNSKINLQFRTTTGGPISCFFYCQ
jgi:hypothetical protein